MPAQSAYTLGRSERIKSRKKTETLFRSGKNLHLSSLRITYMVTEEAGLQVGVSAAKRYFKKAVQRNRIKRLLRETWRLQKNELRQLTDQRTRGLSVFIVYAGKDMPDYESLRQQIQLTIKKLQHIFQKETGSEESKK
jgi:ribonuclease P protein component